MAASENTASCSAPPASSSSRRRSAALAAADQGDRDLLRIDDHRDHARPSPRRPCRRPDRHPLTRRSPLAWGGMIHSAEIQTEQLGRRDRRRNHRRRGELEKNFSIYCARDSNLSMDSASIAAMSRYNFQREDAQMDPTDRQILALPAGGRHHAGRRDRAAGRAVRDAVLAAHPEARGGQDHPPRASRCWTAASSTSA